MNETSAVEPGRRLPEAGQERLLVAADLLEEAVAGKARRHLGGLVPDLPVPRVGVEGGDDDDLRGVGGERAPVLLRAVALAVLGAPRQPLADERVEVEPRKADGLDVEDEGLHEGPPDRWGVRGPREAQVPRERRASSRDSPPGVGAAAGVVRARVPESSRPERAGARPARGARRASRTREPSPWALPAGARGRGRRPGRGRRTSAGAPGRGAPGRSPRGRGPSPKRGRGGPAAISGAFPRASRTGRRSGRRPRRRRPSRSPSREPRGFPRETGRRRRGAKRAAGARRRRPRRRAGSRWARSGATAKARSAPRPSTPTRRARAGRGRASRSPGRRARRRARPPRAAPGRRRGGGERQGPTSRPGRASTSRRASRRRSTGRRPRTGRAGAEPPGSAPASSWLPLLLRGRLGRKGGARSQDREDARAARVAMKGERTITLAPMVRPRKPNLAPEGAVISPT